MPSSTRKSPLKGSKKRVARKRAAISNVTRRAFDAMVYQPALPFTVHGSGVYCPAEAPESSHVEDYEWCREQIRVANAALGAGYQLAVSVPPGFVAQAACAIARSLSRPPYMGYDSRNERLIVWDVLHDQDDGDEATA